jgi:hypothetical protein
MLIVDFSTDKRTSRYWRFEVFFVFFHEHLVQLLN